MRILIITQYFWPENFKINSLATELQNRGHEIEVLTGMPNYPNGRIFKGYSFFKKNIEYWNNIKIYRSILIPRFSGSGVNLFLNYTSFAFFASIKLLSIRQKPDLIFVYEPSPITVGIPAIFARFKFKGTRIFFWVQDLWPDSLKDAGSIKNKTLLNIADSITRLIYKKCDLILVQSKAFIDYIHNQGVEKNKIKYFPNPTEKFYKAVDVQNDYKIHFPDGFNLIFAGNVGEAQGFDTLILTAQKLNQLNIPIYWNILGDGRSKNQYIKKISKLNLSKNFIFHGSFSAEEMPYFFTCGDALIVSLKKSKIFSMTIPAKVQSYLACGKPIIASLDGEGARIIEESNSGYVSPSEDVEKLLNNIIKLYNLSNQDKKLLGLNARKYFEREFSFDILINKFETFIND